MSSFLRSLHSWRSSIRREIFLSILFSLSISPEIGSAFDGVFTKSFSHGFTFTVFNVTALSDLSVLEVCTLSPKGFSNMASGVSSDIEEEVLGSLADSSLDPEVSVTVPLLQLGVFLRDFLSV